MEEIGASFSAEFDDGSELQGEGGRASSNGAASSSSASASPFGSAGVSTLIGAWQCSLVPNNMIFFVCFLFGLAKLVRRSWCCEGCCFSIYFLKTGPHNFSLRKACQG